MLKYGREVEIIVASSGVNDRYAKFLRTLTDAEFALVSLRHCSIEGYSGTERELVDAEYRRRLQFIFERSR